LPPNGGLFASLRGLIATAVALLRTRLELLATEFEEEKLRLLSIIMYGAAALFMFGVGLVLLAVFLAVLFWDTHRLLVMGGLTAMFLLCGCSALWLMLRQVRAGSGACRIPAVFGQPGGTDAGSSSLEGKA